MQPCTSDSPYTEQEISRVSVYINKDMPYNGTVHTTLEFWKVARTCGSLGEIATHGCMQSPIAGATWMVHPG